MFARHPRQADEQSALELLSGISAQPLAPPMFPLRREATEVAEKVSEGFCKECSTLGKAACKVYDAA